MSLLVGGVAMGIAPVHGWPLAWIAQIPLWWLIGSPKSPNLGWRRTLGLAALWGVGYHGVALSWIRGLHPLTWMGIPWGTSVAITLFAWIFITLWGAGMAMAWAGGMRALSNGLRRWQPSAPLSGSKRILLGVALWCAVEWTWSKGPLYWSSLSYTQSPGNLAILQWGQFSGPITVTAAIVAVNGLLAEAFASWHNSQPRLTHGFATLLQRGGGRPWLGAAVALFAGLHLVGAGLYAWPLQEISQQSLEVGLIQGNIPTRQKLGSAGIQASRQVYLDGYRALVEEGADLVITPEGAIAEVWTPQSPSENLFVKTVMRQGIPLILGTFVHEQIDDPRSPITQSLLTLTADGEVSGRYRKIKLVPLGEYLPFESILGSLVSRLSPMGESMAAGRWDQRLETPLGPIAAGICYESAFAEIFRTQVARGAELILTASNNDPYPRQQMIQHHALDVMRAIETDRWAVRVTNTGLSGIVDPRGKTQWISPKDRTLTHLATVYRRQTQTPYGRWGDWLTPLLVLAAIVHISAQASRLKP